MKRNEKGGVFVYIFLALAIIGALTFAVTRMSRENSGIMGQSSRAEQISRMVAQAALLSSALQQMVNNGASAATLATNLSTIRDGNSWDTPPHLHKIYHPYGGGVKYVAQSGTGAALSESNIAGNFQIRKGSYVKGVGSTNAGDTPSYPDILFTAQVYSQADCQAINAKINGAAPGAALSIITDTGSSFANLFTNTDGTTNATLEDTTPTCTACLNQSRGCWRNVAGTQFGYYQVLFPG